MTLLSVQDSVSHSSQRKHPELDQINTPHIFFPSFPFCGRSIANESCQQQQQLQPVVSPRVVALLQGGGRGERVEDQTHVELSAVYILHSAGTVR